MRIVPRLRPNGICMQTCTMRYFDGDCLLGRPKVPLPDVEPSLCDLRTEMQRLDIERALVRHRACIEADSETGNAILMEEIAGQEGLVPAWHVLPGGLEGEFDPAALVERLLRLGVRAAWTTLAGRSAPFVLDAWCAGPLLGALQEHRVPLLLPYREVPPAMLKTVLAEFPQLPVILFGVPRLGRNPILYPLLGQHRNLSLCLSGIYGVHLGLEDLYKRFGADQIIFGSGYPHCEGGASVAALTYADLPDEAKAAIAYGNLERLLGEVQA